MVFKERWSPPLGASVALKSSKSELEPRKLQPTQIGTVVFTKKVSMMIEQLIAYF
jgi:hypothetical protein